MKLAFVFPGQGSQSVGMARDLWEGFDDVKALYTEASSVLGYDLADLTFNGPADELNKTFRTQPALVTASMAAFGLLKREGFTPFAVAGHSLGEYSALVAAGVLSFPDALRLTEKRGMLMQEAVPEGKGLMAAILGLARERLDEICRTSETGYVSPANYNCPGQIVIAGEKPAVEDAIRRAKEAGAKRAVPLAVSVPSHCALMAGASEKLAALLEPVSLGEPHFPVVNNADAFFLTSAAKVKDSLVRQLNLPLLWEDSVRRMADNGIDTFVEVGPGKVLSGLIKRIAPGATILNAEDSASLKSTAEMLSA